MGFRLLLPKALVSNSYNLSQLDYLLLTGLAHPETIDLLNRHATVIASSQKRGSDTFYENFAEFIDLFKKSNYDEGFLGGRPTAVTAAYWMFVKSCQDEVEDCA